MEQLKPPTVADFQSIVDKFAPFLLEVRKRILITVIFFVCATIFGFFFYEHIIRILITALGLRDVNVVFTSPFQFINLAISCGVTTGIVLTFPVIVIQLLSFLKPALRRWEYTIIIRLLPFSLLLFVFGFCFGALVMKWQIEIFLDRSNALGIGNMLDISRLLTTVILTAAIMGLLFEFPIVLLVLMKFGIVKRKTLGQYRKYIYLLSFIIAIFLPPDSILADVLLSLPLVILFECTMLIDRVMKK